MSDPRTILVVLNNNTRRLVSDIPADAKVTFGPVSPGKGGGYGGDNALRIYTSQQNQLAVFVGVKEFRDLALTVKEQQVKRKSKSVSGSKHQEHSEEVSLEWEDSDDE